jgi:hypothetical protein
LKWVDYLRDLQALRGNRNKLELVSKEERDICVNKRKLSIVEILEGCTDLELCEEECMCTRGIDGLLW